MRRLALIAVAAALVYPALMLLYAASPGHAIYTYKGMMATAQVAGLAVAIGFGALAIFYPPFLENVRRFKQKLMRRASTNWNEIQQMEKRMDEVPTPGLALKLGNAYFEIEDDARATGYLRAAVEQDREPPLSARYRLGLLYLRSGEQQNALEQLQEIYQEDPRHATGEILLRLGEACRLTGDYPSARRFYKDFEDYSGGIAELHYQLGLLHEAEGERPAARARMKQALESYQRIPIKLRVPHRLAAKRARWFLLTRW